MSQVVITIGNVREAGHLMQCAECLDKGQPFDFAFDGTKAVLLLGELTKDGFISSVLKDVITPGVGLPSSGNDRKLKVIGFISPARRRPVAAGFSPKSADGRVGLRQLRGCYGELYGKLLLRQREIECDRRT